MKEDTTSKCFIPLKNIIAKWKRCRLLNTAEQLAINCLECIWSIKSIRYCINHVVPQFVLLIHPSKSREDTLHYDLSKKMIWHIFAISFVFLITLYWIYYIIFRINVAECGSNTCNLPSSWFLFGPLESLLIL